MTILQLIKENKQLLIDTILSSKSKLEIFNKLGCYRNSSNIKKLNEFIEQNNLSINNRTENNDKICCQYCGREYKRLGISYHEKYCKENPNKEVFEGNKGKTKGYKIWNKGLTKDNDDRIKKYGETYHNKVKSGEIIPTWLGKKLPKEMLEKIKISMNEFFEKNGNPGWKGYSKDYKSYPEKYFTEIFINYNIDLKFHLGIGRYQLDFYNEDKNRYVEIDGDQHYRFKENIIKDKNRDKYLLERGWYGIRINWRKFINLDSLQEKQDIIYKIKLFIESENISNLNIENDVIKLTY